MKNIFITITGHKQYLGLKPYRVGRIVKIVKDVDNPYDEDAIRVELPFIDTIGVFNSCEKLFIKSPLNISVFSSSVASELNLSERSFIPSNLLGVILTL